MDLKSILTIGLTQSGRAAAMQEAGERLRDRLVEDPKVRALLGAYAEAWSGEDKEEQLLFRRALVDEIFGSAFRGGQEALMESIASIIGAGQPGVSMGDGTSIKVRTIHADDPESMKALVAEMDAAGDEVPAFLRAAVIPDLNPPLTPPSRIEDDDPF